MSKGLDPTALLRGFAGFIVLLFQKRYLITAMARHEISRNYVGSLLGLFWTFINPLVLVLILWFVFSIGLRVRPEENIPFVVWLMAGMAIWNAFSEIIGNATPVIVSNAHLVKRILFPLSILPVVRLLSSFVTHAVFVSLLVVMILIEGLPVSIYWLQSLYYFMAMSVLALGVSWCVCSFYVFVRDTSQFVALGLQMGFWCTPIFWDLRIMPETVRPLLKLNPLYYIVQGYRDSFLYFVPFWDRPGLTLYFWAVTAVVFVIGAVVFLRLRPHFADAL